MERREIVQDMRHFTYDSLFNNALLQFISLGISFQEIKLQEFILVVIVKR